MRPPSLQLVSRLFAMVLVCGAAACAHGRARPCPCPTEASAWPVPCSWLQRVETVAEAERRHVVNGVPFGQMNDRWVALVSSARPGDALWYYSGSRDCPPHETCFRPGETGYLLVRDCTVVTQLVTSYTFTREP